MLLRASSPSIVCLYFPRGHRLLDDSPGNRIYEEGESSLLYLLYYLALINSI